MAFASLLVLTACSAWPTLPEGSPEASRAPWPRLLPLDSLLGDLPPGEATDEVAAELTARADALRRRATVLRAPVPDADAFEELRQRVSG